MADEDRLGTATPYRVAMILVPGFPLMAYGATVEPLRSANLVSGRGLFEMVNLSAEGGPVRASNGLEVATAPLDADVRPRPDMALVCAGIDGDRFRHRGLEAALRRLARHGVVVGAVSTGSFLLARAGLLDGCACTVHWDLMDAFAEAFPGLRIENRLYVIDRDRITCAGGTAAMDLMLRIIGRQHGPALAARVGEQFIHGVVREPGDEQRLDIGHRLGVRAPLLIEAVRVMEETVAGPIPMALIALRIGLSTRQLERLFKGQLGVTPTRFYLRTRLERARRLLRHTAMPVTEVAFACGFESASHFAKCYREAFRVRPSEDHRARPVVPMVADRGPEQPVRAP